jgi:hypothetical protein
MSTSRRGEPQSSGHDGRADADAFAKAPPAGATGTAAIFTEHVKVGHIIRRIVLRQVAILNYVNPF